MRYAIGVAIVAGAVLIGYWNVWPPSWTYALIAFGIIFSCYGLVRTHERLLATSVLAASLILWRTLSVVPAPTPFQLQGKPGEITVSGLISQKPTDRNASKDILIDQVAIPEQPDWQGKIQVVVPLSADWRYGDKIEVRGILRPNVAEHSPYERYLLQHGITGSIKWGDVRLISRGNGNAVLAAVFAAQDACQAAIGQWLPRDEVGLLLGIVLGLQQPLSPEFADQLARTSTTHIIVASGYNATIIVSVVMHLAGKFRRRAVVALVLTLLALYVALSGFNPSMIRAAIMASSALTAQLLGRQRLALHLLYCTAILMLLINPLWIFDTSFQLSFAATIGIILFEQNIAAKISYFPKGIGEVISTTLSAQLLTMPIISSTFGTIALVGLLANFLVLWAVPWIMGAGAMAIPLTLIMPSLGHWLLWFIEPLLWYVKHCVALVASIPFASVGIQLPIWFCLVYYAAVIVAYQMRTQHAVAT